MLKTPNLSSYANELLLRAEIEETLAQKEGRDGLPRKTVELPRVLVRVDEHLNTEEISNRRSCGS